MTRDSGTASPASIRAKNRTATWLTEVFQPPVVVTLQLLMALGCVIAGLVVLVAVGAPRSVVVMVLAIVSGIVVLAAVRPFWKIS
ncbi:MAG: phosphatidic acid phosphatase, partial [Pseudarthrobacter sp.]|nr:phosphatidic acid phosphatase [Pseudarthrobacter sp.]